MNPNYIVLKVFDTYSEAKKQMYIDFQDNRNINGIKLDISNKTISFDGYKCYYRDVTSIKSIYLRSLKFNTVIDYTNERIINGSQTTNTNQTSFKPETLQYGDAPIYYFGRSLRIGKTE